MDKPKPPPQPIWSHIGWVPLQRAGAVSTLLKNVPHRLQWLKASGRYLLGTGTLDAPMREQLSDLGVNLQTNHRLSPQKHP